MAVFAACPVARDQDAALVVGRFDRQFAADGSWFMRILLGSRDAVNDREAFLTAQLFFWLIAAPDGHAKNFSVFIERGGRFRLTPLYDIMSAYPVLGYGSRLLPPEKLKMAMAFSGKNRQYEWHKIRSRHLRETARRCGMEAEIDGVIGRLAVGIPYALADLSSALPQGFPERIAEPIFKGVAERAALLEAL